MKSWSPAIFLLVNAVLGYASPCAGIVTEIEWIPQNFVAVPARELPPPDLMPVAAKELSPAALTPVAARELPPPAVTPVAAKEVLYARANEYTPLPVSKAPDASPSSFTHEAVETSPKARSRHTAEEINPAIY